jgi:hypothetical protein
MKLQLKFLIIIIIIIIIESLLGNDLEKKDGTTFQHSLIGNGFLISKYKQPLSSNALANKHVPTKRLQYNSERCFLRGPCRGVITETSIEISLLPSAWGYNRATLFLGDINTWTWSQIWDSKMYCILYIVHCKRQIHPLVREGAPYQKPAMVWQ